ncbi:hypothetical protein ACH4UM_19060 [Streptomyces sp. NPDC020801]|uniref:hypothetical protein n=1 Tax=Streptomyces sp. NPDC020801 TaxID=3365093 RepID=UPI00379F6F1B
MPTKPLKDEPTPQETAAPAAERPTTATEPGNAAAEPSGPEPGVYEYTHFADCVYPHVPLTCRAATADAPATVFDWPFGPPDDGRWTRTRKKPTQAADNAGPLTSEE